MENQSQKVLYGALADFVFVIHLVLVFLVVFGWLVPALFYAFLGALVATILSEIFFGYCILSKIEFGIRRKVDPHKVYDKSCIVHYFRSLLNLPPRVISSSPKSFLKKNMFIFILLALLLISLLYKNLF